jgi:hypothetical protein
MQKEKILHSILASLIMCILVVWMMGKKKKDKEMYMYGSHENRPWRTVHEYMLPVHRNVRKFRRAFARKLKQTPTVIMPCHNPLQNYTPALIMDIVGVPSDNKNQRSLLWKNLNEALQETCRRHFPGSRGETSETMADMLIRLNGRGSNAP